VCDERGRPRFDLGPTALRLAQPAVLSAVLYSAQALPRAVCALPALRFWFENARDILDFQKV